MLKLIFHLGCLGIFLSSGLTWALDPVAPRAERRYGMVYVKSPNPDDKIVLVSQRQGIDDQKIESLKDVQVPVGDYVVEVSMEPEYSYAQPVTVRPTERHEIIVPGYGNVQVNGKCDKVRVLKDGKEIAKMKCGEVRTLPRGSYDLKIEIGKYTLDQSVGVVTNTLRQVDIVK